MKAIFNDGTELQIQQAYLAGDGALRIKVISAVATQGHVPQGACE